jgi:hypothetical protein
MLLLGDEIILPRLADFLAQMTQGRKSIPAAPQHYHIDGADVFLLEIQRFLYNIISFSSMDSDGSTFNLFRSKLP